MKQQPRTVAIIQARLGSTRLPGKILKDLGGKPALQWVVDAARLIPGVTNVVVATSDSPGDDPVIQWCAERDISVCRGSEDDVLSRFYHAAEQEKADTIIRLTGDCPFLDPHVCGQVLALFRETDADYAANHIPPSWPDGLDCEVFTREVLETTMREAIKASDREHVTPFIYSNQSRFKVVNLNAGIPNLEKQRWTLDTPEDYRWLNSVAEHLDPAAPPSYMDILALIRQDPALFKRRDEEERNAGYSASQAADSNHGPKGFEQSNAFLKRALETIPTGSQTFSKCHLQYPDAEAPLFVSHARGGRLWDIDGNEFVDLICGLLPVGLGYCDPDVDLAIREQLNKGISFSLSTTLEAQLAERMIEIIPCAEMVRFGKNGSDATSGSIRLARAFTKRDRVMVSGYHGWQDWYIGSTSRSLGVPQAVQHLTHSVPYNDLDRVEALLKAHPGEFAAMILEPMNVVEPHEGYLSGLKELLHQHGALLIFDEVITGFRYALGGAQEHFGVTPDLAAFGKAMGNGMPIAAVTGRRDIMTLMEEIFFSGTFGGEALSIAASIAVIDKMRREPVINRIWETGGALASKVRELVDHHGLQDVVKIGGKPPWSVVWFNDHPTARKEAIKALYMRGMLLNGVLTQGSHNICYAHDGEDLSRMKSAYDFTLAWLADELNKGGLEERLPCGAIEPVFKVR